MTHHGTIQIIYANRISRESTPKFIITFADYGSLGGAVKRRHVWGEDMLIEFLVSEVGIRRDTVESLLPALGGEGNANVLDVALSDEELMKLGLV